MNECLPAGFYRAEAQWLSPPEHRVSPDEADDLLREKYREVSNLLLNFGEVFVNHR